MTSAATVYGAPEGWDAFLLARRRAEFAGPILHVARDDAAWRGSPRRCPS